MHNTLLNIDDFSFENAYQIAKVLEMGEKNTIEFCPATSNATDERQDIVNKVVIVRPNEQSC